MRIRYLPILVLMLVASLIGYVPAAAQTPETTPHPQADVRYTWDLEAVYPDSDAWEKDYSTVAFTYLPQYEGYQGRLGDADALLEYLQLSEQAGVDMTTGAAVNNLLAEFERTIRQMEDILRRQGKL